MVGVPGRGKGCATCKKRKKKCDLQVPTCGNCAKRNLICGGYAREMLIVHVDNSGKGTYKPQKSACRVPPRDRAETVCFPADIRVRNLNRTANESLALNAFWDLYLPRPCVTTVRETFPFTSGSIHRWASYTTHYAPQSEIVRCALLALSTAQLGRTRKDNYLMQRGFELYGQALSQIGNTLKAPNGRKDFGVINSCRLLALFEEHYDIIGKTTASSWQSHVHGLLGLIQHHPLETFSLPGKHEVFLEARLEGILSALCDRKATFLASPEWMTKPWTGRIKSALDTVMDILAQIPGVFEGFEVVMLQECVPETDERASRVRARLWELEAELTVWHEEYISLYRSHFPADPVGLELLVAGRHNPAIQTRLPEHLIQHGVAPLYAMTMFWACCTIVYDKMLQLDESFPPGPQEGLLPEASKLDLLKYCICLSRSTRLLSEPDAGLASNTLFAGAAVACVISGYIATGRETEAEREDMTELQIGLQDVMDRSNSMWTQTWAAGMNHMTWRHDPWWARASESTRRFWAGKHWYNAQKTPLEFRV